MNVFAGLKKIICIGLGIVVLLQAIGCTTFQTLKSYKEAESQQYKPEVGALVIIKVREDDSLHPNVKSIKGRVQRVGAETIIIVLDTFRLEEIKISDILEIEILQKKIAVGKTILAASLGVALLAVVFAVLFQGSSQGSTGIPAIVF